MEFVKEQKEIIETDNKNIIVSASAGSGKTFTMLSKVFHIMKSKKVDISRIMLLTYTNSAGNEMKIKIYKLINENIEKDEDKEFLISQIDSLPSSTISTFHSFYEKIIREYYYKLGINPSFSIITGENLEILKNEAFLLATKKFEEEKKESFNLILDEYSSKRNLKVVKELIFSLYDFLTALDDEKSWRENFASKIYENPNLIKEILQNYISLLICTTKQKFNALFKKAKALDEDDILKNISFSLVELENFERLSIEEKVKNKISFPRFAKKDVGEDLKLELKSVKEFFNKTYAKLKLDENSFENFEENLTQMKKNIINLLDLYDYFAFEFEKLKCDENTFDFVSLEKLAYELLKDETTRKSILSKFDYVFVDEYQDVNKIQDSIVSLLGEEKQVFLVGDPKQSIYAFKQSDVELFNDKEMQFKNVANCKSLPLKSNFRTNKDILDFCNVVFSNLMTKQTMGINYKQDAMFDAKSKIESCFPAVNLLLCKKNKKETEEEKLKVYSIADAKQMQNEENLEALCILDKISNLLSEKIYDEKIEDYRKVEFGDIAILFRSRGDFSKKLISLFNKYCVPYTFNDRVDLKQSKSVLAIISFVKLCSSFYEDVDVVNVLTKFFGYSFNDLNNIVLKNNYIQIKDLLDLEEFAHVNECVKEIKQHIELNGVYFAAGEIISKENFTKFITEDENEVKYFLKFILENNFNNNPIGLITLFENSKNVFVEVSEDCGQNKVILTTMHASKGLEYPIVFIGDMSRQNGSKGQNQIIVDKNLGIYVKDVSEEKNSAVLTSLKIEANKKDVYEEIRVLYVGLTRAKNLLYMCGTKDDNFEEINENNILFSKNSHLNFVVGSLGEKTISKINEEKNFRDGSLCVEFFKDENKTFESFEKEKEVIIDEEVLNKYKNFTYKIENVAQKTTVTNLNSEDNISNFNYSPKIFEIFEHEQNENNQETGVLYHSILENIDFCKNSLDEQIEFALKDKEQIDKKKAIKEILVVANYVKKLIGDDSQSFKEKEFMLYVSPKEVLGNGSENKILIQGKIDFFSIGKKVILIDYKFSNLSRNLLIEKYEKQLKIYAFALENAINRKVDEMYLINIKNGEIINLLENKK